MHLSIVMKDKDEFICESDGESSCCHAWCKHPLQKAHMMFELTIVSHDIEVVNMRLILDAEMNSPETGKNNSYFILLPDCSANSSGGDADI